jgi:hypothetical protein
VNTIGLAVLVFRGDWAKDAELLVFIEHRTRRTHLGGVTANPTGERTVPQARNLALSLGDRFEDIKFLIRDRGSKFTPFAGVPHQFEAARYHSLLVAAESLPPADSCAGSWRRMH